jgi:hypothetical protein
MMMVFRRGKGLIFINTLDLNDIFTQKVFISFVLSDLKEHV